MNGSEEQLVKYLADAHSIEEQALTQMRAAPAIARDDRLAAAYREHLVETEGHEHLIRERLEAHGADPSRVKDLAGTVGGWGMLRFARSQPDSPGKLSAHAFSYESMEVATYGLLRVAAEAAGDLETAAAATAIGEEEERMAARLAGLFDVAVEASLEQVPSADLDRHLHHYLQDAHALELQAVQLLELGPRLVGDEELATLFSAHLEETREQERKVVARLEAHGAARSKLKDLGLRGGALNIAAFFAAQPDTDVKLAGFGYAFENLEIATYELLRRVAERAGDAETAAMAEEIRGQELEAAKRIASTWERIMQSRMLATAS
jgi:ferritin-like metal-binding protein YciE